MGTEAAAKVDCGGKEVYMGPLGLLVYCTVFFGRVQGEFSAAIFGAAVRIGEECCARGWRVPPPRGPAGAAPPEALGRGGVKSGMHESRIQLMAHISGDAGRYPKAQARRVFVKAFEKIVGLFGGFCFVAGVAVTASFRHTWWLFIPGLVGSALLGWEIDRRLKIFDNQSRAERRRYLRGGEGEEFVALELSELPDDFHVFHSFKLDARNGGDGERDIDHLVVGPSGVWAISTKNLRGRYEIRGSQHVLNGDVVPFGGRARQDAADLYAIMDAQWKEMGFQGKVPWVQAVVVLPFAWVEGDNLQCNPMVLNSEQIELQLNPDRPRKKLTARDVGQLVGVINAISVGRSVEKAA